MEQRGNRDKEREREELEDAIAGVAITGATLAGAFFLGKWVYNKIKEEPKVNSGYPARPSGSTNLARPFGSTNPAGPSGGFFSSILSAIGDDELSLQIEAKYNKTKQSSLTSKIKENFGNKLIRSLKQANIPILRKQFDVLYLGSSVTPELALDDSDLDLCIKTKQILNQDEKEETLGAIRKVIAEIDEVIEWPIIISKLHPIIQFLIKKSSREDMKVDLQMYSHGPMRSTLLVANYIRADKRFPKLAIILKLWTREYGIAGTQDGLSSYALVLMLIYYLQVGCSPSVLPCLHRANPQVFNSTSNPENMRKFSGDFISANKQNLGDLLIGFFQYYSRRFDFNSMAISVNSGNQKWNDSKEKIYVEEPFSSSNVVKLNKNKAIFSMIKSCLDSGYEKLSSRRNLYDLL